MHTYKCTITATLAFHLFWHAQDHNAHAFNASQLIDFENLSLGDLEGQEPWLSPLGSNEFEVVQTSSSGDYEGGQGVKPNGLREAIVNEIRLPRPEAIATYQLPKQLQYPSSELISISFDVLFDGRQDVWLWFSDSSDAGNMSPAFGIGTFGSYRHRYHGSVAFRNEYSRNIDVQQGHWLRLYMVLDSAEQLAWFREDNLTTGAVDRRGFEFVEASAYELNRRGRPDFDPLTWDQVNVGWRNGTGVMIDNILFPLPVPEPVSGMMVLLFACLAGMLDGREQLRR